MSHSLRLSLGLALLMALASPGPSGGAPVVIAHRGASGYLPEHTLVAKAMAHAMGPDYIEQDVVLTRDGVPVVIHDHHLDTVTDVAAVFPDRHREDGRYYVIDFTLEEVRRLTVHERTDHASGAPVFPERFPASTRIPLLKVPTLEEEIQLIQGLNASTGRDVGLYVELKSPWFHRREGQDLTRVVLDLLARYGYRGRDSNVLVQSFDPACLERIRGELRSQLRLVQLVGENAWKLTPGVDYDAMRSPSGLRRVAAYADGLGPSLSHLVTFAEGKAPRPTGLLARAHELGLVVHPYTLRKDALPAPIRSVGHACQILFAQLGVDGVFTDHPDLVVDFLDRARLRRRPILRGTQAAGR